MINELSDKISTWLQSLLTPDKTENIRQQIEQYISSNISRVAQHKIDLYLGYIGFTKQDIIDSLHSQLPAAWNDTAGKAIEELIKSLGG